MKKIYLFEDNVAFSEENERDKRWEQFYRTFFPRISYIEFIPKKDERQKVGIDKIIHLEDGKQHNIDEKVDRKGYPRFPIEIWQAKNINLRGWAVKEDQKTNYIAYLVKPSQEYYLIPYEEIKDTYYRNEQQWLNDAHNRRNGFIYAKVYNDKEGGIVWETHNVCVPFDVLMNHIPTIQYWKAEDSQGDDDV